MLTAHKIVAKKPNFMRASFNLTTDYEK